MKALVEGKKVTDGHRVIWFDEKNRLMYKYFDDANPIRSWFFSDIECIYEEGMENEVRSQAD